MNQFNSRSHSAIMGLRPGSHHHSQFGSTQISSSDPFSGGSRLANPSDARPENNDSLAAEAGSTTNPTTDDEENKMMDIDLGRKFLCQECGHLFTRKHNLKSHLLIHSKSKPHICTVCNSRFRRSHDLKRHRKLHTGEKPFRCATCGRTFARSDALVRHNNSQSGCDVGFKAHLSGSISTSGSASGVATGGSISSDNSGANSLSSLSSLSSTGSSSTGSTSGSNSSSKIVTDDASATAAAVAAAAAAAVAAATPDGHHPPSGNSDSNPTVIANNAIADNLSSSYKNPNYGNMQWKVPSSNINHNASSSITTNDTSSNIGISNNNIDKDNDIAMKTAVPASGHLHEQNILNAPSNLPSYSNNLVSNPQNLITSSSQDQNNLPSSNSLINNHSFRVPSSRHHTPSSSLVGKSVFRKMPFVNQVSNNETTASKVVTPTAVATTTLDPLESSPSSSISSTGVPSAINLAVPSTNNGSGSNSGSGSGSGSSFNTSTSSITLKSPLPVTEDANNPLMVHITKAEINSMLQYIKTLENKIDTLEANFARSEKNFELMKKRLIQDAETRKSGRSSNASTSSSSSSSFLERLGQGTASGTTAPGPTNLVDPTFEQNSLQNSQGNSASSAVGNVSNQSSSASDDGNIK